MSADRQYAIAAQFRRTLGVDLLPTQTRLIEELVEASIAEGGPGWPEFAAWLRDAKKLWPSPIRRRAETIGDSIAEMQAEDYEEIRTGNRPPEIPDAR